MQVAHETGRAVVLVGHSLGGLTVSEAVSKRSRHDRGRG
jgi:predicted alpha/beta hydrolase family esterase